MAVLNLFHGMVVFDIGHMILECHYVFPWVGGYGFYMPWCYGGSCAFFANSFGRIVWFGKSS